MKNRSNIIIDTSDDPYRMGHSITIWSINPPNNRNMIYERINYITIFDIRKLGIRITKIFK